MVSSAIDAADRAFAVLVAAPSPLKLDGRDIVGLPDRQVGLDELRTLLIQRAITPTAVDAVWRRMAERARTDGPMWVIGAVGLALPGLIKVSARLRYGHPDQAEDIDSEVIAGFLQALRSEDLTVSRVWWRLLWAAWRAGCRVRTVPDHVELPPDLPSGATIPKVPYGHPDLIIGRAAAVGVLTHYEADLIADTRLGGVLIEQLADQQSISAPVLRRRRVRAEQALVAALTTGELSDVALGASFRRGDAARRLHDQRLRVAREARRRQQ